MDPRRCRQSSRSQGQAADDQAEGAGRAIFSGREMKLSSRPNARTAREPGPIMKADGTREIWIPGLPSPKSVRLRSPGMTASLARRRVHLLNVLPVDEILPERLEIIRPTIAIVDVIGMFPDVD